MLPALLLGMGLVIDFSRMYLVWVNLESGARDAAQYLATSAIDDSSGDYTVPGATANPTNDAKAIAILNAATNRTFGRSGSAALGACSAPMITTITRDLDTTTGSGGSAAYPVQQAEVLACIPFRTLFAYPLFTQNGDWILRSDRIYKTIVGR